MCRTYAPEMSTHPATVPRPPNSAALGSRDRNRSEIFWAAFAAAPSSPTRWADSATAAWRPAASVGDPVD